MRAGGQNCLTGAKKSRPCIQATPCRRKSRTCQEKRTYVYVEIVWLYQSARYYDPSTGRFNRLDDYAGDTFDPQSLHKYLYVQADPIQLVDPSGEFGIAGLSAGFSIGANLQGLKIEADLVAFDVAVAAAQAVTQGQTTTEALRSFFVDQAFGFGIGFAIGKLVKGVGSLFDNGINIRPKTAAETATQAVVSPIRRGDGVLRVAELRRGFNVGKGKNIAFAEVNIDQLVVELRAVSGQSTRRGFLPPHRAAFFDYSFDRHFRGFDSEAIILENLAQRLSPDSAGTIRLFTERAPCKSCRGVIEQFQERFPKIKLITSHGPS